MKIRYTLRNYLDATTHSAIGASLTQWLKMLRANFRSLDWRFAPRVVFITIMICLYTPLRIYEKLFINRKARKQKVKAPVFILGHYRSGTTFLHYLLGNDTQFAYASTVEVVNPHSFVGSGKLSEFITRMVLPGKRPMDNLKMSTSLPFEEEYALSNMGDASLSHGFFFPKKFKEHFQKSVLFEDEKTKAEWKKDFYFFLQKLSYKHDGKTLLLKTPANTGRIKEILEIFPDAKFINIYRNPYKVYLSNEGLYEKVLPILAFHKVSNEHMESYILDSYKGMYLKFIKEKSLIKDGNFTEVAYENFVQNPIGELKRMYDEIDLDYFDDAVPGLQKVLEEYKSYKTNSYTIDQKLKDRIYKNWSFAFKAFGYKKDGAITSAPDKINPTALVMR